MRRKARAERAQRAQTVNDVYTEDRQKAPAKRKQRAAPPPGGEWFGLSPHVTGSETLTVGSDRHRAALARRIDRDRKRGLYNADNGCSALSSVATRWTPGAREQAEARAAEHRKQSGYADTENLFT